MAKYRRKQEVVEAVRWEPGKSVPGVEPVDGSFAGRFLTAYGQRSVVHPGDYLIREPDGLHWRSVPAERFEAEYELLEA
jgi:hypothetical protein